MVVLDSLDAKLKIFHDVAWNDVKLTIRNIKSRILKKVTEMCLTIQKVDNLAQTWLLFLHSTSVASNCQPVKKVANLSK